MSEEEIRMRCLELAAAMLTEDTPKESLYTLADLYLEYVKDDGNFKRSTNKITFEKVSQERNEK